MAELNIARLRLLDERHDSVIVQRDGTELYRSPEPGVRPLIDLVDTFPEGLPGATVLDRVVGGCAARIFVLLGVAEVLGIIGSEAAIAILNQAGINCLFRETVREIRSRDNSDTCPFEKLSRIQPDAAQMIAVIRDRLDLHHRGYH